LLVPAGATLAGTDARSARASAGKFPDSLVDWSYAENSDKTVPVPHACGETRRSTCHS
jgi:hypothetical protein